MEDEISYKIITDNKGQVVSFTNFKTLVGENKPIPSTLQKQTFCVLLRFQYVTGFKTDI